MSLYDRNNVYNIIIILQDDVKSLKKPRLNWKSLENKS